MMYEEEIEKLKLELENVRGSKTEVYSRICGYYRDVKQWNVGQKQSFEDRVEFEPVGIDDEAS